MAATLVLLGAAVLHLPDDPALPSSLTGNGCRPGRTNFTSSQPPALPGEWHGSHGFFAIPGTLELEYCRPGQLRINAHGDVSSNGGPPMLVVRNDEGQTETPVRAPRVLTVPVGPSGRVILSFPNDETDALYRIVTIERLAITGTRSCVSALVRDERVEFRNAVTGAVYDQRGQRLEPCTAGTLFLTVSGPVVDGAGPQLRLTQAGWTLLDREVRSRVSLRLPLNSTAPVQLSVTNFAGRQVQYRNLFLDRIQFTPEGRPASGGS